MWQIVVDDRGARLVQGARWATVVGVLMVIFGAVGAIAGFIAGRPIVGIIFLGLMLAPGVALTQTLGKMRERPIASVAKTVAVPGGVTVTLLDSERKRHELETDADTVRKILESITQTNDGA